jgi:hypothetical protein
MVVSMELLQCCYEKYLALYGADVADGSGKSSKSGGVADRSYARRFV